MLRAGPDELKVLVVAAEHAARWQQDRDRALARLVVKELADAMKRGKRA